MGFGNLGIWEILVIAVIILLFFGPRRLPEIARSMGGAMREFKRGLNELQREFELAEDAEDSKPGRKGPRKEPTGTIEPRGEPPGTVSTEEKPPGTVATEEKPEGASTGHDSAGAPEDPSQSELFGTGKP